MEELSEEKALRKFSWRALFAVTACSSFIFSMVTKFLEGHHSAFLLKTGGISAFAWIMVWLLSSLSRRVHPQKGFGNGIQ